ncbi:HoxN/HupN/NixA family nickel/cobalt transporter [Methylolobus aquaticus]
MPTDWSALIALVFTLGLKHGVDADHLAMIDGLTRYNAPLRPRLARWCGLLFSLGHGAVVIAISVSVGALSNRWEVPAWAADTGAWISIAFLTVLGIANLRAVLSTPHHLHVRTVGLKSRLLGRFQRSGSPLPIALIGALFALSFDTLSQASLFALTATQYGGWIHALTLGAVFTLGMLIADSANGLWISRLINRADRIALVASRVMGLTVAGISLGVASFGAARYFVPAVDSWGNGKELALGGSVVAVVALSFLVANWLSRPQGDASATIRN